MPLPAPKTTSFRPTDRVEISDPGGRAAAVYDIPDVARVRVWSTGGFIGDSDAPMIHVGIQIENIGRHAVEFDGDSFELVIFHECGAQMPAPMLMSIVPLRPSPLVIPPATCVTVDLYFKLLVGLQRVASMRARWSILLHGERLVRSTSFVRDDDAPTVGRQPVEILPGTLTRLQSDIGAVNEHARKGCV